MLQRMCQCMQELKAAAIRKAEQEKPSFRDEPLETQRVKRAKAPVTPILPPGAARLAAASAATSASAGGPHVPELKGTASASKQAAAAESAGEKLQRAGHQWPSQVSGRSAPESAQLGEGTHAHPGSPGVNGAAEEQHLDVEEVEWKPGDAGVTPASSAGVGSDSSPAQQAAGAPSSSRYAQRVHSSPAPLHRLKMFSRHSVVMMCAHVWAFSFHLL